MLDGDGLAIEGSLLVGVSGQLYWLDGARLLGKDDPQIAVVVGEGDGQQSFERAGIEVGEQDGGGMEVEDISSMMRIYGPALQAEFTMVEQTPHWTLWRRKDV